MTRIAPMEFLGPAVRLIRKSLKLTLEAVANQVPGYDSGNLSRFERGQQSIDTDKLQLIAQLLGKSVSDIYVTAEGLEQAAKELSVRSQSHPHVLGVSNTEGPSGLRLQSHPVDTRHPFEAPSSAAWEFVLIACVVVNTDTAGRPVIAIDRKRPEQALPKTVFDDLGIALADARLLTVPDDAMLSVLASGDLALIDTADTGIQSGRVYALLVQDEIWVRRVNKTPTSVIIHADNSAANFEDFEMSLADFKRIQVIGRVRLRWGSSGL